MLEELVVEEELLGAGMPCSELRCSNEDSMNASGTMQVKPFDGSRRMKIRVVIGVSGNFVSRYR